MVQIDWQTLAREFGVDLERMMVQGREVIRFARGDDWVEFPLHVEFAYGDVWDGLTRTFGPPPSAKVISLDDHRHKPDTKKPAEILATVTIRGDGSVRVWIDADEFTEPAHWWWLHTMMSVATYQFLEMEKPLVVVGSGPSDSPFPPEGDDK